MKNRIFIISLFILFSICYAIGSNNVNTSIPTVENETILRTNMSNPIPFKILKKPYAWDIKSVTYLGRKNGGYNILVKGVGTRDWDNSKGLTNMQVSIGFYLKNGKEQITGAYFFPAIKKGEAFSKEFVVFLPAGHTPSSIGGFLFTSGFEYEEEPEIPAQQEGPFIINAPTATSKGAQIQIQYIFKGEGKSGSPQIPENIKGFDVLFGPSRSQNTTSKTVNGKITTESNVTYTYVLRAKEEGTFTLPAATINVDGRYYKSGTAQIRVLPPDQNVRQSQTASANNNISPNDVCIRAIFSKTRVKEQDAIDVTFRLYTVVSIKEATRIHFPEFKEFTTYEIALPPNLQMQLENYKERNYQTIDIKKTLLFPEKSGKINLPVGEMDIVLQLPSGRQAQTIFGPQDVMTEVKKTIKTPPVIINIKPSEDKQANSSGNIDSFNFDTYVMPLFPGGEKALLAFISGNLKYPVIDQENGVQGTVVVGFTVDTNGKTGDIKIKRSVSPTIDKEAIRLINALPDWEPGLLNDKPANVEHALAINFKLN